MKKLLKNAMAIALIGVMCLSAFNVPVMASTSVENMTGSYYKDLVRRGVVDQSTDKTPVVTNENTQVASVDALGKDVIIVTLDSYYENFNVSDIKLEAYNSEWYNLKPQVKARITVTDSQITRNAKGQTVIVYKISQNIDGNRLENDYSVATLSDSEKTKAITTANNYITWQMDHGGWDKGVDLHASRPWNGVEKKNVSSGWTGAKGELIGTIDNDATYTHMRGIALAYALTGDAKYKTSIEKGVDFILKLQTSTGGLTQVYPKRGNYSDYVTFNDDAMINTLIMLEDMQDRNYPFGGDLINQDYDQKINTCLNKAIDYIIKSQILSMGAKTAWCAQHDPVTYAAREARAYEHPSISGSESVGIIKFLMHQEQTPEVKAAVDSSVKWFRDSAVNDTKYVSTPANADGHFVASPGSRIWYRFYEIGSNKAIFSDRDGIIRYNLAEVGQERREGYSWAGTWANTLLTTIDNYGYYPNRIQARVIANNSVDTNGKTLKVGSILSLIQDNLSIRLLNDDLWDKVIDPNKGDADGDGVITGSDAAIIFQYILNKSEYTFDDDTIAKLDVDNDGLITSNDVAFVLNKVLDSDFSFS